MAWYWLIFGCVLSGLLGFFICAMFFMGSEADDHMESIFRHKVIEALGNREVRRRRWRAERCRAWRENWRHMKREV